MAIDWTPRERATLTAIAGTFVAGPDDRRRGDLIAEALESAADPDQVRDLRLALRAMELPVANLLLGGGARGLTSMTPAQREAYLRRWAASPIAQRRSAFHALRKLSTFLAYADALGPTGEAGTTNPRHAAIGYGPERPPVASDLTPIVPLSLPFAEGDLTEPMTLEADVVIVGSGAGGGVVAADLAAAGRSVVVLEAGPFVDEASMPTNELDAYVALYLERGLLATWDGSVTLLAGSAVGGGTLVNWMTTIEAPASVREAWRTEHGVDGLADGETWTADVAAIESEMGVAPSDYLPPKDDAIVRGATALGWEAGPTRRNATGCDDCGSCPFGCRRGSKRSGIRAHLVTATARGARIVQRVRVTRVLVEGGRAVGVEGLALVPDPITGAPIPDASGPRGIRVRPLHVRAPQVVVSAGALRTPAVLQGSGLEHPAIGRYLRVHPVTGALTRQPYPVELWRGPMQAARSLEFLEPTVDREGYVIESAPGHPGLLALALPWEGAAAHADLMADARHLGAFIGITRDSGEGRASLTRHGRVRLDYRLDARAVATLRHAAVSCARLARASDAVDIVIPGTRPLWSRGQVDDATFERFLDAVGRFDYRPNFASIFSAHQMGTARMGADPADHACDPSGRVRVGPRDDRVIGGLYVADTSLFPTGLGVNPMLTVMVLARRVARTVLAEG